MEDGQTELFNILKATEVPHNQNTPMLEKTKLAKLLEEALKFQAKRVFQDALDWHQELTHSLFQ
jgi:hypothetical protein